jgi:hypothetical protein
VLSHATFAAEQSIPSHFLIADSDVGRNELEREASGPGTACLTEISPTSFRNVGTGKIPALHGKFDHRHCERVGRHRSSIAWIGRAIMVGSAVFDRRMMSFRSPPFPVAIGFSESIKRMRSLASSILTCHNASFGFQEREYCAIRNQRKCFFRSGKLYPKRARQRSWVQVFPWTSRLALTHDVEVAFFKPEIGVVAEAIIGDTT